MVSHSRLSHPDTHSRWPYRGSICGYRATPTDVSPIGNLCRIIMPVHRLWSPRTRRYAGLISCSVLGLSQWIMGGCTVLPPWLLISTTDLPSPFIRYAPDARIFKTAREIDELCALYVWTCNSTRAICPLWQSIHLLSFRLFQ